MSGAGQGQSHYGSGGKQEQSMHEEVAGSKKLAVEQAAPRAEAESIKAAGAGGAGEELEAGKTYKPGAGASGGPEADQIPADVPVGGAEGEAGKDTEPQAGI